MREESLKKEASFRIYPCWLMNIRGFGSASARRIAAKWAGQRGSRNKVVPRGNAAKNSLPERNSAEWYHGFARDMYLLPEEEVRNLCREALGTTAGEEKAGLILRARFRSPEWIADKLRAENIRFCSLEEEMYPVRLRNIPDPPYVLYYRGRLPAEKGVSAAIIGARMASRYGFDQARIFAEVFAENGVQVISGMARGIDSAAGFAALNAGGYSGAVLGCGVDVCYPKENQKLFDKLAEKGGLISEYPPGTQPEARLFPPRNRLISGLADAVVVIEAKAKSGTLITVDMALEQGREVFAVPGRLSDKLSEGCNALIAQGAEIAISPERILEEFFERRIGRVSEDKKFVVPETSALLVSDTERILLRVLSEEDFMDLNLLMQRLRAESGVDLSAREISSVVTALTIRGIVKEIGIGQFQISEKCSRMR